MNVLLTYVGDAVGVSILGELLNRLAIANLVLVRCSVVDAILPEEVVDIKALILVIMTHNSECESHKGA
jgi:hypothetical protein